MRIGCSRCFVAGITVGRVTVIGVAGAAAASGAVVGIVGHTIGVDAVIGVVCVVGTIVIGDAVAAFAVIGGIIIVVVVVSQAVAPDAIVGVVVVSIAVGIDAVVGVVSIVSAVVIGDTVIALAIVGIVIDVVVVVGDAIIIGAVIGVIVVSEAVVANAVVGIHIVAHAIIALAFHHQRSGPVVCADTVADVGDHIIQESLIGEAGAGLDLQSDLAAFTFHFFHEVTGITDGGDQIGDNVAGGLADQAFAGGDDCQGIIVAGGNTGNGAVFVILNSDLGIDAQNQNAAVCQRYAAGGGSSALTAGGQAQHQGKHTCDCRNHFLHNSFSFILNQVGLFSDEGFFLSYS